MKMPLTIQEKYALQVLHIQCVSKKHFWRWSFDTVVIFFFLTLAIPVMSCDNRIHE